MGLLDDAIREHLDLKRRRGADPAEIQRAEQEALGPVRRDPIVSEDAPGAGAPEAGAAEVIPPVLEPEPSVQPPSPAYGDAERVGGHADEPAHGDEEDWDDYYEDEYEAGEEFDPGAAAHPPVPSQEAPQAEPRVAPDPDEALGDTVSYDAEREAAPRPDQEQEDVLEETPEFLQDTPDHDRLWFEQRPPRDFDFDE